MSETNIKGLADEVRRLVHCAAKGDNPEVITAAILTALRSEAAGQGWRPIETLREAAAAVLEHRVGAAPGLGYLRDNDQSRAALQRLSDALNPTPAIEGKEP